MERVFRIIHDRKPGIQTCGQGIDKSLKNAISLAFNGFEDAIVSDVGNNNPFVFICRIGMDLVTDKLQTVIG